MKREPKPAKPALTRQEYDDWVHNDDLFGWAAVFGGFIYLLAFGWLWLLVEAIALPIRFIRKLLK